MIIIRRLVFMVVVLALTVMFLASCSGPDEKKTNFFNKGKELYEKEDYVRARLELKNAVQIDPKFSEGYHLLGLIAMKTRNLRAAYGNFSRAVELDPGNLDSHVQIGGLLLSSGKVDGALAKADLVLKNDADNENANILKGSVLLAKKNTDDALRFLKDVVGSKIHKPDGYLLLSLAYQLKGDEKNAEKTLWAGVKANEKSVSLYLPLINLALKRKQTEDAIKLARIIIDIEPKVTNHRLTLASILWDSGKEHQAVEILKNTVSAEPRKEELWIQVAGFYIVKNKPEKAEQVLKDGIHQNAKSFLIRFTLVDLLASMKSYDQAIAVLKDCQSMDKDPASQNIIQTKNTLARIYLALNDLDKAKLYIAEVIKESPNNSDANYIKGMIHLHNKEGVQAVSAFRVVVNERPQFIPGYINLADAHLLNNETNIAFDTIKNALKDMPNSRELIKALARLHISQRNYKEAEKQYQKILDANPKDLEVRADMGDLFQMAGESDRAEKEYMEIKQQAPKQPLGYMKLSTSYIGRQKWDKAITELEQLLQIQPDFWPAANDLAFLLADHGQGKKYLDRALTLAKNAQSLNPSNPDLMDTLGWVYYRKNDIKTAIEWLENAWAGSPKNPVVNYHMGMAYYKFGNTEKAKEYLQLALNSKVVFTGREQAEKIIAGRK